MIKLWTKHVVLEGADCTGKTTLAHHLFETYGFAYHHEGVPPGTGSLLNYYAELLTRDVPTVFDRLHLGELVYGPIMRGRSRLSEAELRLLDQLVAATGSVVVICAPSRELVVERWRTAHASEYVTSEEKIRAIYDGYLELRSHCTYIDPAPRGFPGLCPLIPELACSERLPRDVVGFPSARFLFVGERSNVAPGEFHLPFFADHGSSRYLRACLRAAGYRDDEVAFTNALTVDEKPAALREKLWKPDLTVTALGMVAAKALVREGIPGPMLPHPQYWKRFHATETDAYVEKLKRIKDEAEAAAGAAAPGL
jgi:hypothetical protein